MLKKAMQIKTKPSFPSITSLLKNCKTQSHLLQIHAYIIRKGLEQDHISISQFMVSLSKTLSGLDYSTRVFNAVRFPSTALWNVLVKGFTENSRFHEAVSVFVRMKRKKRLADEYTYPLLLKLCASEGRVREGMAFHGLSLRSGFDSDVFVRTSLIDFYGKCKDVESARKLFNEMPKRNVVSWTAMVSGYVFSGELKEAKKVFDEMPKRNSIAWNAMIDGLAKSGDLRGARKVFNEMPEKDVVSFAAMIEGYAKIGDMVSARSLFDRASMKNDALVSSALISGYAKNGLIFEALNVFKSLSSVNVNLDEQIVVSLISACSKEGNPEIAKWVDNYVTEKIPFDLDRARVIAALIDMNAKCGNMERAKYLFEKMPIRKRDLVSYCSMIHGLSIHGRGKEAVDLFDTMVKDGFAPDEVAFTVILSACSRAGLVSEGLNYFKFLTNDLSLIVPSPDHYSCIIDLLGRSGQLKEGYEILKSKPVEPFYGAWCALLGACKVHGDTELGELIAARIMETEPRSSGNYVILSQIYADKERWSDVSLVRDKMVEKGVRKTPGRSWIISQE